MKRKTLITYIILYFLTFISTIFISKLYFENQSKKVYENYIKIAKEEISKEKIKLENNKSTKKWIIVLMIVCVHNREIFQKNKIK